MIINLQPTPQTQVLINKFRQSPEILGRAMRQGIQEGCLFFKTKAQQFSPVDTTKLRGSISSQVNSNTDGRIFTNTKYAPYQEYGTGIYAGKGYIYPKKAKFLVFKNKAGKLIFAKKVKGVKGRFYFKKAGEELKNSSILDDAITKVLKKELWLMNKLL